MPHVHRILYAYHASIISHFLQEIVYVNCNSINLTRTHAFHAQSDVWIALQTLFVANAIKQVTLKWLEQYASVNLVCSSRVLQYHAYYVLQCLDA